MHVETVENPTDSPVLRDGCPPSICSARCLINSIKLLASREATLPFSVHPSKSHSATEGILATQIEKYTTRFAAIASALGGCVF